MASTHLHIRIDADTKKEAQQILFEMGMDLTTAVNLFIKQIIHNRNFPFLPSIANKAPSAVNPEAQRQAEALDRFFEAIDAIEDEPITDEDIAMLERNRVNFRRELDV